MFVDASLSCAILHYYCTSLRPLLLYKFETMINQADHYDCKKLISWGIIGLPLRLVRPLFSICSSASIRDWESFIELHNDSLDLVLCRVYSPASFPDLLNSKMDSTASAQQFRLCIPCVFKRECNNRGTSDSFVQAMLARRRLAVEFQTLLTCRKQHGNGLHDDMGHLLSIVMAPSVRRSTSLSGFTYFYISRQICSIDLKNSWDSVIHANDRYDTS